MSSVSSTSRPASLPLAAVFLVGSAFSGYSVLLAAEKNAPPTVGDVAPALELKDSDNRTVKLAEAVRKGPVVVMVLRGFPGYQCPLCSRQAGQYMAAAKDLKQAGASVIMVYPGPGDGLAAKSKEFLGDTMLPEGFQLLTDPDYVFTNAWNLRWDAPRETAYPSTFVVDTSGRIRFAKVSRTHGDRAPAADVIAVLKDL